MVQLDMKELHKRLAREQYKFHSTLSLSWFLHAEKLYRASQVLFETAKNAMDRNIQLTIQEFKEARDNKNPNKSKVTSRTMTLEERRMGVDIDLILPSFYLLARSIEVLLKAVLIERQADYFLKPGKQILDTKKLKHDLNFYIKEFGINLNESEQVQINLLIQVNIWGTYPIPVDEATWINIMQERYQSKYVLNIKSYPQVALLYGRIVDIFNEEREKINKKAWINIFST